MIAKLLTYLQLAWTILNDEPYLKYDSSEVLNANVLQFKIFDWVCNTALIYIEFWPLVLQANI